MTTERARRLALALPDAVELDHHGRPSFRVGGRIFATVWDDTHLNVMLSPDGILAATQSDPATCAEVRWGRRLAAVRVDLRVASPTLVAELLGDAWRHKSQRST